LIGKTISHYEILEKLGEGGMGVVYKAEDTKLKRTVALKFLPQEITRDQDAKTRFVHEAQAASALQHNNICTIHEIDETRDGQMFICMDYYDGENLRDKIKRGPVPVTEAIDIATNIAAGLAKAHEAGMVHRDVKPANLVVTSDGVVKVVDFGLAKLAGTTRVTKTGMTVGTVAYMSPEQARGEDVDHRSDIFSLGAVFYELLTGELPFKGDHEAAVLYGIANNDPPALNTCRDGLPDGLQRVIDKALAKDVDDRYQSALELNDDIAEFGEQTGSGRAGARSRSGRRRPRWGRLFAGVAGVAVVVTVAAVLWPRLMGPVPAEGVTLAVVDFNDVSASDEATRSVGMAGLIHVGLVENSPCRVVSPSYLKDIRRRLFGAERGPIDESQVLEVARESGATVLLSGQMGELDGQPYVVWQLVDTESGESIAAKRAEGAQMIALADAVLEGVVPALAERCGTEDEPSSTSVTSLTTANSTAYEHYVEGTIASERAETDEAIKHLENAVAIDTTFALAFYNLAKVHMGRNYGEARTNTERAWRWRSRLSIQDRLRLEAWREQLFYRGVAAIDVYRELHTRWPDDLDILKELTARLFWWWFVKESLEVTVHAMGLFPDEPAFVIRHQSALAALDRPQEALDAARDLVARFPDIPNHWDELALRFIGAGLPDSAEVAFQEALQRDPGFLASKQGLATLPYYRGDLEAAVNSWERFFRTEELSPDAKYGAYMDFRFVLSESGKYSQLLDILDEAGRLRTDPVDQFYHQMRRHTDLLRVGRADEVLQSLDTEAAKLAARTGAAANNAQLAGAARLFILQNRPRALVAMDSLAAAREAAATLMASAAESGNWYRLIAIRVGVRIALKEGDANAALEGLDLLADDAVRLLGYIPYLEQRAEAYRIAGRLAEAVAVHEDLLRVYRGHALSHYQLGLLYEEMDRPDDAAREYRRFLDRWANADEDLPQLADARERLSALASRTP